MRMQKHQGEADTAKINNSLGCLYLDMGRYPEAYELLFSASGALKQIYGESGEEFLSIRRSIASYYFHRGEYNKAESELKKSWKL